MFIRFALVAIVTCSLTSYGVLIATGSNTNGSEHIAPNNFSTATALFRDGYRSHRIIIFGEHQSHSLFHIDTYIFSVIPDGQTRADDHHRNDFNGHLSNMAAHMNGMAVMLACKWMTDQDPRGQALLDHLKAVIPHFMVSYPGMTPRSVSDLNANRLIVGSLASQWGWHMNDNHTDIFPSLVR